MRLSFTALGRAFACAVLTAAAPSPNPPGSYQLHNMLTPNECVSPPCPNFQVKDRRTGEVFHVASDFRAPGKAGSDRNDVIVEAYRIVHKYPEPYSRLTNIRIVGTAGEAEWNGAPKPTERRYTWRP
ncbi:MAG: hypothetical protein LBV50_03610 [Novosphingobium sp.]|jgi:hypothetical protein|nr:hypothetical protein [Novosphingobium sp.]